MFLGCIGVSNIYSSCIVSVIIIIMIQFSVSDVIRSREFWNVSIFNRTLHCGVQGSVLIFVVVYMDHTTL